MRRWMIPLLAALPATAAAGYPDDITLTALDAYDGEVVTDTEAMQSAYYEVVKQLGAGIANKPLLPGETLGISGFDVSFSNNVTFLDAHGDKEPSAWERVSPDNDPTRVLWLPTVGVRKGLPFSLEVGANLGYLAFSRQATVGGYGRWGLIEGYRSMAPDLSVQVGYTGYVGNPELNLGVLDAALTVGYTLPFGMLEGIHQAAFSPFFSVGLLSIKAEPRLSESDQSALGVHALPCWEATDDAGAKKESCEEKGFKPVELALGMQVLSNDFFTRFGGAWSPGTLPTVSFAVGLSY